MNKETKRQIEEYLNNEHDLRELKTQEVAFYLENSKKIKFSNIVHYLVELGFQETEYDGWDTEHYTFYTPSKTKWKDQKFNSLMLYENYADKTMKLVKKL